MAEEALSDLKVLDLGHYIAGPYCTRLLAGYGAEVIKVEPPGEGDPARRVGPFFKDEPHLERSGLFLYLNARKKGITLNLKTQAGASLLKELVKEADILVENFEPRVMPSLGLSYETLKEVNPSLVMVSITNFGQTGPYRDFKGSNLTTFAMGGQMAATGEPDREPIKNGGSQAEYQGGLNAFAAAAAVSYRSKMSGQGEHVDISIMECMCSSLEGSLPMAAYSAVSPTRVTLGGRRGAMGGGIGLYPCRDGYVGVHLGGPRAWPPFARVIGRPDLEHGAPATADLEARLQFSRNLVSTILAWTMEHDKMEIYDIAGKMRACFAPVLNTKELLESPQLKAREFFVEVEHPETGTLTYPGAPFKMSETPWQAGRAPLLGEHNEEVYCGRLGYSGEDLVRLKSQGVI